VNVNQRLYDSGSIARGGKMNEDSQKGSLGAISTYVDEFPATKWDCERLAVYFQGKWADNVG
jgi:hypothetical protein